MIVTTVNDILNSVSVLQKISEQQMPVKTAFKIMKLIKQVNTELIDFNNIKKELIERYGKRDSNNNLIVDDDNNYTIADENKELFTKELTGILNEKVEITAQPLQLDDLIDFNFSPNELEKIDYCICDE